MNHKRGLLFFISSCIPGCGQMHLGYMKRGVSLLTVFFGLLALIMFLNVSALLMLLPIIWLYAFYDSYNLRNQTEDQAAANPDAYLFGMSDVDSKKLSSLCRKRHSFVGWGLILVGLYMFYDTVVSRLLSNLSYYFPELEWLYYTLMYDLPKLVATVFIIILGIWFIRGPKKTAAPSDDIPVFVPPAEEESHGED